uniref:FERM and PDZ domain containing 1 n=1 Tax=Sinocyclocheilus anshuiensis TaxID=1608454 RepID=A0A671KCH8_9TELE
MYCLHVEQHETLLLEWLKPSGYPTNYSIMICVSVFIGGPADGKLVPGDQLFKINNVAVDDLSTEQAADIIRYVAGVSVYVWQEDGPKSSFITPEKRAKLKSNPVKVRFAEEVVVNGHSQGNSLLFLPNVLKVYLENGQTKAFKLESKTTVKDIVMTLKEKLSISRIEHFSLVLEQQYSISKLYLLHEEEIIQKVVEKKETHDYRCLFRVCFLPRDFTCMLKDDPVAFEYLYLQSISDVLQERFAVEMKCNTALRLAALHVQEKLASSGQSLKTPLKAIMKEWGIESFVSHTLLRNMREKDLKKAISYHVKKILSQEPKQKVISVDQARLNYMNEMSEVKSYGGKAFSATMMLQDRESTVSLLVGAQYGVSQVINHKLSIMTTLTEFSSITRVELLPESDRVSLVKIYLQDIKPITLLMESVAAKDLLCLVAGYCRLLVDPQICVFPWSDHSKGHRISAEEGTELLNSLVWQSNNVLKIASSDKPSTEKENKEQEKKPEQPQCVIIVDDPSSEASDSYQTESHFMTSMSSDSIDALEEDDLMTYFSTRRPCHLPDEKHEKGHYYNICTNVTPDSAQSLPRPHSPSVLPTNTHQMYLLIFLFIEDSEQSSTILQTLSLREIGICASEQEAEEKKQKEEDKMVTQVELSNFNKRSKKRRSFMETNYTSLVSFPEQDHLDNSGCSDQGPCPTVSSLTDSEGEPAQLESKPINPSKVNGSGPHNPTDTQVGSHSNKSYQRKQQLIEMEPDSMEFKSVNELMSTASPAIVAVCSHMNLQDKGSTSNHSRDDQEEGTVGGLFERLFGDHLFFDMSKGQCDSSVLFGQRDQVTKQMEDFFQGSSVTQKSSSLPRLGQISPSSLPYFHVPSISYTTSPDVDRDDGFVHLQFGMGNHSVEPTERTRSQSMSASFGSGPSRHLISQRVRGPEFDETDNNCDPSLQELSSGVPSYEPAQSFLLTPCSSGILGRLSASTLRGKIQNLPLYLSRSQEMLNGSSDGNGNVKPVRRLSEIQLQKNEVEVAKEATEDVTLNEGSPEVTEVKVVTIVSEEVTEVIEEVREVSHIGLKACGQLKTETEPKEFSGIAIGEFSGMCSKADNSLQVSPSSVVVTTQNLNGPWGVVTSSGLQECSHPPSSTTPHNFTSSCGVFANCQSKPTIAQPKSLPSPNQHEKPDLSCSSVLAMGCETVMEGAQTPLEVCHTVYTNCFSGVLDSASFDDELTVYEFSRRTSQGETRDAVLKSVPPSSLSASPASFSPSSPLPSFPHLVPPASSSTELSPLLSPLDAPDCFLSDPHEDIITSLLTRRYPLPPTGFLSLQRDVDTLLNVLAGAMKNQDGVHKHTRDTCVAHFSENKRQLHAEARGLLAGCQRVVRVGQTPEETLQSLSESFRSLVQLTSVCLCFSNCQRCRERHAQALTGLASVAKTYQGFARAAELVGSVTERKTCHDLSIKLLARQCTALTTSVFCLTQLFRTLTAL